MCVCVFYCVLCLNVVCVVRGCVVCNVFVLRLLNIVCRDVFVLFDLLLWVFVLRGFVSCCVS